MQNSDFVALCLEGREAFFLQKAANLGSDALLSITHLGPTPFEMDGPRNNF